MQTEVSIIRHYSKHLKADEVKGTKEYQVKKLMDILGLTAKIKDRMADIKETSKSFYGVDKDGKILSTQKLADRYSDYRKMLKRVEAYYNNNLSKLNNL